MLKSGFWHRPYPVCVVRHVSQSNLDEKTSWMLRSQARSFEDTVRSLYQEPRIPEPTPCSQISSLQSKRRQISMWTYGASQLEEANRLLLICNATEPTGHLHLVLTPPSARTVSMICPHLSDSESEGFQYFMAVVPTAMSRMSGKWLVWRVTQNNWEF